MALSMDEQHVLEEMERALAGDDPLLASRLASFGSPGLPVLLRARRVRIILSVLALIVIAAVSLGVLDTAPFRASSPRPAPPRPAVHHSSQPVTPQAPRVATTAQD